ncbi:retrovirus-related pol polyprotein from transposon TNT 1-94, partial [Tanacetum coccineum]
MQGTSLTKQERKCKLYDASDKFAHIKGEALHKYYLRFTQLINGINIYKMKLEQFYVNTKFLNNLPPEWSKCVMDVKLVRDLHTTNFDQLHAYLQQHEIHANEVHIIRERNQDPLALVNSGLSCSWFNYGDDPIDAINKMMSFLSTVVTSRFPTTNEWSKCVTDFKLVKDLHTTNYDQLHAYIKQHELHANEVRIMRECNQDPLKIVANHQMTPSHFNTYQYSYNNPQFQQQFSPSQSPHYESIPSMQHYSTTYPSIPLAISYPSTPYPNAYSSTIHQEAFPQPPSIYGLHRTRANTSGTEGNYSGQQRVEKCFNCQREGHMARQCRKPKRKRDATWFRDKFLLVKAQGNGKVLNDEELEFLVNPGITEGPVIQSVITHNAAYQTDDLDVFDFDCDEISTAKDVLMANLSSYGSYVLSEVPHSDNTHNDMLNQSVQEMPYFEQTHLVNYLENEITSDNNIILYSQYLLEAQNAAVKDINSSTQQDAMILSMFEELSHQEKDAKHIDKEIALEKKVKELENIKALGFQNLFYLKKAQHTRLMLYDGSVIAKETNVISIADSKETLMLKEESRSKMLFKQNFGKRFVPQQELSDEQAFKLQTSHPNTDQFASSLVKIEAPQELPKKQFLIENDRLLDQIISQDIVNIVVNSSLDKNTSMNVNSFVAMNDSVNYMEMCNKCLKLEAKLIKQHNMVEKDEYNRLSKSFSKLEQHCISLKLAMQLNKEIFQKNNTSVNQTEPSFDQLFKLNNLKAELQEKDTTIKKLKANIKRLNKNSTTNNVKRDIDEIETINIELEHKEKVVVITTLKNDLKKLKGKEIADNAAQMSNATTIALGMYKFDPIILAPKVKNNREAHEYYLKHTMEQAAILREVVERAKSRNPLDSASYSALDPSTSARGSKPSGNTKNDRISRTPSSNEKNKVEVQSRKVKSSLNKKNSDSKNVCNKHVKHPIKGVKALCSICNECLFDANHVMCLIVHVNSMNVHAKSASKKNKKRKEWKPTGKVFNSVRYKWKPTGRTFTLVGNACPLTRLTATNKVPLWAPIPLQVVAPKHVVTRVYTRRPKVPKSIQISKPKVAKSMNANIMEPCCPNCFVVFGLRMLQAHDWRSLSAHQFRSFGTVKFSNDQVAKIMGYGDYQIGNVTILRVYYVKGLGHNLFLVGQLCYSDLEVAFRKHTCFVRNLEGVDLFSGSRGTNLYSLSIGDMMSSSPICLLSKATKTKSWLWHRRLSHLNFDVINHLARHGLVHGLPKLKFEKDHLCSACAMGKSKKQSHKPKSEDTNQEKLYLLHMDLCGPMPVANVNGKKYIHVIVDDYSRFTWVKFLASKDEALDFIIKFLKMIQIRLNATVWNIRTDNGTEFVNQTLRDYYEQVGISHETSVARTPQQNGVVERQNRTFVEVARTMLIYAKAPLFLWVEAVATACYTQNLSIIRRRHGKTPYELLHDRKPNLS